MLYMYVQYGTWMVRATTTIIQCVGWYEPPNKRPTASLQPQKCVSTGDFPGVQFVFKDTHLCGNCEIQHSMLVVMLVQHDFWEWCIDMSKEEGSISKKVISGDWSWSWEHSCDVWMIWHCNGVQCQLLWRCKNLNCQEGRNIILFHCIESPWWAKDKKWMQILESMWQQFNRHDVQLSRIS